MGIISIACILSIILIILGIVWKKKNKNKIGNIMLILGIILMILSLIPGTLMIYYLLSINGST